MSWTLRCVVLVQAFGKGLFISDCCISIPKPQHLQLPVTVQNVYHKTHMTFLEECCFSSLLFRYISLASLCVLSGILLMHSVKCVVTLLLLGSGQQHCNSYSCSFMNDNQTRKCDFSECLTMPQVLLSKLHEWNYLPWTRLGWTVVECHTDGKECKCIFCIKLHFTLQFRKWNITCWYGILK